MHFSIILTTYQRTDYLEQALFSIYSQTFKEFEVIVVDSSNNNIRKKNYELVNKYHNKIDIKYIENTSSNLLGNMNRKIGSEVAKGKYISFLDDDDYWLPFKLEILYKEIINNDYDMIFSNYVVYNENLSKKLYEVNITNKFDSNYLLKLVYSNIFGGFSGLTMKNRYYQYLSKDIKVYQDYSLFLNILAHKNIVFKPIDKVLYIYRLGSKNSITSNFVTKISQNKRLAIYKKYFINKNNIKANYKEVYLLDLITICVDSKNLLRAFLLIFDIILKYGISYLLIKKIIKLIIQIIDVNNNIKNKINVFTNNRKTV